MIDTLDRRSQTWDIHRVEGEKKREIISERWDPIINLGQKSSMEPWSLIKSVACSWIINRIACLDRRDLIQSWFHIIEAWLLIKTILNAIDHDDKIRSQTSDLYRYIWRRLDRERERDQIPEFSSSHLDSFLARKNCQRRNDSIRKLD